MPHSKAYSPFVVFIAGVFVVLIVAAGSYYIFSDRIQDWHQQLGQKALNSQESQNSQAPEQVAVNEKCYQTYTQDQVSFSYPCDWQTNVTGQNTMSAVGTVVAPDGKASFHYPAPEFGLHGMDLTAESSVTINGNEYSTTTYQDGMQTLVLIEMGTALSRYGYQLMLAYANSDENSESQEDLAYILETFQF